MNDDDLFDEPPGASDSVPTDSAAPDRELAGSNHFETVFAFVDEFLVHVYARLHHESTPFKWCPWWHHHPEAVSRLSALWQSVRGATK